MRPHLRRCWLIPPKADCQFVAQMEDVLEVYKRPYDPRRPVVCVDEQPKQILAATRTPLPAEPGVPMRYDHEYVRLGVANIFMAFEPLAGKRHAEVRETRTRQDFAHVIKSLLDGHYADAEKLVLVTDQLNTHTPGSFYATFGPAEARRLLDRIEWHHTPKHGSWLDMAEIELSALSRQCLERHFDSRKTLADEVAAWNADRDAKRVIADWHFTTDDARIKLKRLYPSIEGG